MVGVGQPNVSKSALNPRRWSFTPFVPLPGDLQPKNLRTSEVLRGLGQLVTENASNSAGRGQRGTLQPSSRPPPTIRLGSFDSN